MLFFDLGLFFSIHCYLYNCLSMSLISAQSHSFMEIDHEIFSKVLLLLLIQEGPVFRYSKTYLKRPLKEEEKKNRFLRPLPLNGVQKYCRMLSWSILQYFWPALNYHMALRPLFCLFLSGPLRVSLYKQKYVSVEYWDNDYRQVPNTKCQGWHFNRFCSYWIGINISNIFLRNHMVS